MRVEFPLCDESESQSESLISRGLALPPGLQGLAFLPGSVDVIPTAGCACTWCCAVVLAFRFCLSACRKDSRADACT